MAYLRTLKNGGIQAAIRLKGFTQYQTFQNKKQATDWATRTESNIKLIRVCSVSRHLFFTNWPKNGLYIITY